MGYNILSVTSFLVIYVGISRKNGRCLIGASGSFPRLWIMMWHQHAVNKEYTFCYSNSNFTHCKPFYALNSQYYTIRTARSQKKVHDQTIGNCLFYWFNDCDSCDEDNQHLTILISSSNLLCEITRDSEIINRKEHFYAIVGSNNVYWTVPQKIWRCSNIFHTKEIHS